MLKQYGNRTNSLVTLYSGFETYAPEGIDGFLRFSSSDSVVTVAGEPLAPEDERALCLDRFIELQRPGTHCIVLPIGITLATTLKERGFYVWQVGSEPVFELDEYFRTPTDPLDSFPVAKTLRKRGAEVLDLDFAAMPEAAAAELQSEMQDLVQAWLESKSSLPLGFLSQVKPFELAAWKKFFALRVRGRILAFIAAAPIFSSGVLQGYYFVDIIRHPQAKAGVNDLLVIEAMRLLHAQGVGQARLGMSPLARIRDRAPGRWLLTTLFEHWRWGYQFLTLYDFKDKFRPTQWEPLFLASSKPGLLRALYLAASVHFPEGLVRAACHLSGNSWGAQLALRPEVMARRKVQQGVDLLPGSLGEYLWRTKCTTALVAIFVLLHLLRQYIPALSTLFERSAYVPGAVNSEGLWLGPFFHNHWFHLFGDQLSFYAAGALIELILGPRLFWLITALGLWLSNPLTHGFYALFLDKIAPRIWNSLLLEQDYGSSNAVFALVGAYALLLVRKMWLLLPFFIYGVVICFARQSWLALHHLLTLGLGMLVVQLWLGRKGPKPRP